MSSAKFEFGNKTNLEVVCDLTEDKIGEYKQGDPIRIHFELESGRDRYYYEGDGKCFGGLRGYGSNIVEYFMNVKPELRCCGEPNEGVFGGEKDFVKLLYWENHRPCVIVNLYRQKRCLE